MLQCVGPQAWAAAAPVARADDPNAIALANAQAELKKLRERVASLEAELAKPKEKKGLSKLFS